MYNSILLSTEQWIAFYQGLAIAIKQSRQPCETWSEATWILVILVWMFKAFLVWLFLWRTLPKEFREDTKEAMKEISQILWAKIRGREYVPKPDTSEEPAFDQTPGKPVKRWKVEIRLIEEETPDGNAVETVKGE